MDGSRPTAASIVASVPASPESHVRVLHHGNVAQNGYNNAKFLRRLDIAADVVCDESQALAQPEWEDAVLGEGVNALDPWSVAPSLDGWTRPDWVVSPRLERRRVRGSARAAYLSGLARRLPRLLALAASLRRDDPRVRRADVVRAYSAVWMQDVLIGDLGRLYSRYDLVQAYATHAILPLVTVPERPFVAFEHGTLRDLPFEDSWRGRMLSLAYRRAARVIITNADVIASACRLGLENTTFIPHPVDETKYTPGESELGRRLRADGHGPIVLAPARQDWREKRNDVIVRALAARVHGRFPNVVLFLGDWGVDVARTSALIDELRVRANVRWTPPVPKLRLIELYRAADVVLDQFAFGTFGVTAPEAMACAKPVVMAFDPALHEWCFPELPPIVDARDERTLAAALERLAENAGERERLGAAGRAWVEQHHGWRLVAGRQRDVYEEVLGASV